MSLFGNLFPTVQSNMTLTEEKKELESKIKRLERQVEEGREDLKSERRAHIESDYLKDRDAERSREALTYEITTLKSRLADVEKDLKARAEKAEKEADQRVEEATAKVKAEAKVEIAQARVDIEADFMETIDDLKEEANDNLCLTARAEGESKQKDTVIKSLTEQVRDYQDFTKFVLTKLPNVDLSKFNINVDVAPAEVTVVSGGQKPEQKKN